MNINLAAEHYPFAWCRKVAGTKRSPDLADITCFFFAIRKLLDKNNTLFSCIHEVYESMENIVC